MTAPSVARYLLVTLLFIASSLAWQSHAQDAASGIQACLDCHDYGENAPAHQVLLGSHGIDGDAEDMAGRRGCLDCHGDSKAHSDDPRRHGPDLSFGPRWSATGDAQDQACLSCHQQDAGSDWEHALHMENNVTCVTCHDIHTEQDRVLLDDEQNRVCTTCHKAQKTGIHDLGDNGPPNPPCSLCHNPHNDEAAEPHMRANQSAGCTFCHDSGQMESVAALNPKAGNYHRAFTSGKRGCIDCHQGISHAAEDSAPLLHPLPVRGREVTLFYPGNATRQWLTSEHPGSQPLRQGTDCSLCHRGDEAQMGAKLGADFKQPSRRVGIAFSREANRLLIDVTLTPQERDSYLSLMWGDDSNTEFRRGGCFAACHDTVQSQASRVLFHGTSAAARTTMGALTTGAELWRIALATGELETARVGAGAKATAMPRVAASVQQRDTDRVVRFSVDISDDNQRARFTSDGRYTFGLALHGKDNPGRQHWVSLPMTLSLSGNTTDFIVE